MPFSISKVSFEHHRDEPLGIGEATPRISWRFNGSVANWEQSFYDLEICRASTGKRIFRVDSPESVLVPWPDSPLSASESATIRVRAHGKLGQPSTKWSRPITVETGLLDKKDWKTAIPITAEHGVTQSGTEQPIYFRKHFVIPSTTVTKARLYITALGLYDAEINGWQSYDSRLVYDTYDVSEYIRGGDNAIGVTVGEGWYAGKLWGQHLGTSLAADKIGIICLLVIQQNDGTEHIVPSDTTWRANTGPITSAGIFAGETYDSRKELGDWTSSSYNSSGWFVTVELPPLKCRLVAPDGPLMRRIEERKYQKIFRTTSGKLVVDFGQNLVGWLRLVLEGLGNAEISVQHAEVMEGGEISRSSLRGARARDIIILSKETMLVWEPKFTFHGFRYVQITGLPASYKLGIGAITAIVVHSDMERTGHFSCSNPLLNKLHENIIWSMKGNFLSVPTDCPQRDERAGWTGDAQIFLPTSQYLYNSTGFWRGWMKDLWFEQQRAGTMIPPWIVPETSLKVPSPEAVWGDAAVANPWNLFLASGDLEMLKEQYDSAKAWINIGIPKNTAGLWDNRGHQFGDWLDPYAPPEDAAAGVTPPYLVADAYLVRMTQVLAWISGALGRDKDAEQYLAQHTNLVVEFQKAWMSPPRSVANLSQSALTLILAFELFFDETQRKAIATILCQKIAENNYLIGTGYAGTPLIGHALSSNEATHQFYRMLLQTGMPSWLYQITMGASTMWERWDAILPDGTVHSEGPSFNHYSFGSVADWMHKYIGGISALEPGWKKIKVSPIPNIEVVAANASYISPYGEVWCKWWIETSQGNNTHQDTSERRGPGLYVQVQIPPNTSAVVILPELDEEIEIGSGFHEYFIKGFTPPE
ncbi:unnamed protein product [Penicillium palitans]